MLLSILKENSPTVEKYTQIAKTLENSEGCKLKNRVFVSTSKESSNLKQFNNVEKVDFSKKENTFTVYMNKYGDMRNHEFSNKTEIVYSNVCTFKSQWQINKHSGLSMKLYNSFNYADDMRYEGRLMELPLHSKDFKLVLVLPNESDVIVKTLFATLTNQGLAAAVNSIQPLFTADTAMPIPMSIDVKSRVHIKEKISTLSNGSAVQYGAIAVSDEGIQVKVLTYELQQSFAFSKPKVIFCQSDRASDVQLTLNNLNLDAQIVSFDKGDYLCSFKDFMEQYGDDSLVEDFKCTDFDPEDSPAFLIATSGTTGLPKAAAVTHKNFAIITPYVWSRFTTFPTPTRLAMIGSPLQWLTAILNFITSPMLRFSRLQTSQTMTQEHAYDLINTYRPTYTIFSPTMMMTLLKPDERDRCDFTSLELLMLGGSAVPQELIDELKIVSPDTEVLNVYGMSELGGVAFHGDNPAPGSCGKPMGCFQYRIIDVATQQDIYESNVPGELWIKGPSVFKEYYNNVEATEETFAEDRWFKTGDTFYRDDNWNFFFVERIKLLLKYKSYQISPVEIEGVIRQHPGVLDVAVTGVPDAECGDLPVACVVPRPGAEPSADEIKDWVKESLSDAKQLRGGVIFVDAIPLTASTKVHRRKLKQMALDMPRE